MPTPKPPAAFTGGIILELPEHASVAILSNYVAFYDEDTRELIPTVTAFSLHGQAGDALWAELTMIGENEPRPFLVTSIRVREA